MVDVEERKDKISSYGSWMHNSLAIWLSIYLGFETVHVASSTASGFSAILFCYFILAIQGHQYYTIQGFQT